MMRGDYMDIRVLEYFLMVAREENITKAANLLHVTQPTLSRQIMGLEEELGVKLLERSNHSVFLTKEGILFRKRAQELVNLAWRARSELVAEEEEMSGTIAIGCGEMRSVQELAVWIAEFQDLYPDIKFELYSGDNEDIKDRIERGNLDMGLFLEPVSMLRYEFIRMKTREEWGVLVHKDHPLSARESIHPGDLIGTKVVTVHIGTPVHHELAAWSGDYARDMDFSVNYNILYNAVVVAREKKSAVICIKFDSSYDDMTYLPLRPRFEIGSLLAWKNREVYSKAVRAFIDFVRERYQVEEMQ